MRFATDGFALFELGVWQVDIPEAGLKGQDGKTLADNIQYTLGSTWSSVPATQQTLSATANAAVIASTTVTPPSAPQVRCVYTGVHIYICTPAMFMSANPSVRILLAVLFYDVQVFTTFLLGSKAYGYNFVPQG